eukprot:761630-Hanusia_phi.AAC.2
MGSHEEEGAEETFPSSCDQLQRLLRAEQVVGEGDGGFVQNQILLPQVHDLPLLLLLLLLPAFLLLRSHLHGVSSLHSLHDGPDPPVELPLLLEPVNLDKQLAPAAGLRLGVLEEEEGEPQVEQKLRLLLLCLQPELT